MDGSATFTTETSRITITWAAIIRADTVQDLRGSSADGAAAAPACGTWGPGGRCPRAGVAGSAVVCNDMALSSQTVESDGCHGRRPRDCWRRENRQVSRRVGFCRLPVPDARYVPVVLVGRQAERAAIAALLDAARTGAGGALV